MTMWAKIGALILILLLCLFIEQRWTSYTDGLMEKGRVSGEATCDKEYKGRDNLQLQKVILALRDMTAKKEALEKAAKEEITRLGSQLTEQINANKKLSADNRLLTGSRGVRRDAFVQTGKCAADSGEGTSTQASGSTSGSNEGPTCDLSPGTKQSLRDIGLRADETALQLAACQALVIKDRKFYNSEAIFEPLRLRMALGFN